MWHFLVLLIFVHFIEGAERCVCNQIRHPQHEFCESDFAFRVRIITAQSSPLPHEEDLGGIYNTHLKYEVEILETFKGTVPGEGSDSPAVFYTPQGGLCGETELFEREGPTDNVYLFMGDFSQTGRGHLYYAITICNWIDAWNNIREEQRDALRGSYGDNCDCIVTPVSAQIITGGNPEDSFAIENCFYNPLSAEIHDVDDCETDFGICTMDVHQVCNWQNDGSYAECYGLRRNVMATGSAAITSKKQCKLLTGRKRKKCLKKFIHNG